VVLGTQSLWSDHKITTFPEDVTEMMHVVKTAVTPGKLGEM